MHKLKFIPGKGQWNQLVTLAVLLMTVCYVIFVCYLLIRTQYSTPSDHISGESGIHLSEHPIVAVLSFITSQHYTEHLSVAEGVRHDFITKLAKKRELNVIGGERGTCEKNHTLEENGFKKGYNKIIAVHYLIEGDITRENGQIHASLQLHSALSDSPIWSNQYTFSLDENFFSTLEDTTDQWVDELLPLLSRKTERLCFAEAFQPY